MTPEAAREFSESSALIGQGWWRQVLWAAEQDIPAVLGLSIDQWRAKYYGQLRLPREERREAVAELAAEGMANTEIAAVLGVDEKTVRNDRGPSEKSESRIAALPQGVATDSEKSDPASGQTALLDLLDDGAVEDANEELAAIFTTDDDRARDAFRRAIGEVTTAQARIVQWHDRWTPEQRREIAAALNLARRDLHAEPSKLEVVR